MDRIEEVVRALEYCQARYFDFPADGGNYPWRIIRIAPGTQAKVLDTDDNEVWHIPTQQLANAISWDYDKRHDMCQWIKQMLDGLMNKIRDDQADFLESVQKKFDPQATDDFWYDNPGDVEFKDGQLVMVIKEDLQIFDDPTLRRRMKEGAYCWVDIGFAWLPPGHELTGRDF